MRSVTVRLEDLKTMVLNLGFVGENEHTRVTVDCKKLYDQYPGASASLTVQPPEGEAYPAVIERDGDSVIWDVTDSDLLEAGTGELQLSFTAEPHVAKSVIGRFKVSRSIVPTGEVPEPLDDFLTRAGAAVTAIPETINSALATAKASGEFDGPQGPAGADGADGQDGVSPAVAVEDITGGHRVTVTDASGDHTFDVLDGEVSKEELAEKADKIHNTVTDQSVASVPDACVGTVDELVLQLDPIQAGSGDPSPSNVRAISGRDSVVVYASGADTSDPDEHTAQLPVTVYGGEVDWKRGKVKVTHAIIDMGTLSWVNTTASGHTVFRANPTGMLNVGSSRNTNGCCSHYKMATNANDLTCFLYEKAVYVRDDSYEGADAFKTAITGENYYLCYPLATPVEYDLSSIPEDITLVFGENNIWIDNGKVKSMTYPCDTKKYIDKKVAELQALILDN